VVAAERNAAAPALITGARSISYGELLNMIARVSNHLLDRGLPSRAKLFINIGDPDLRLIVTIAALHAGLIPFALMDIGDLKDEVDHDVIVGAAVLQLPSWPPTWSSTSPSWLAASPTGSYGICRIARTVTYSLSARPPAQPDAQNS